MVPELVSKRAMCMDYVSGESLAKAAERLSQATRGTKMSSRCLKRYENEIKCPDVTPKSTPTARTSLIKPHEGAARSHHLRHGGPLRRAASRLFQVSGLCRGSLWTAISMRIPTLGICSLSTAAIGSSLKSDAFLQARLVVLDWGMCITLPPEKPLDLVLKAFGSVVRVHAYAHLFIAAATSNPWSCLDSALGVSLAAEAWWTRFRALASPFGPATVLSVAFLP